MKVARCSRLLVGISRFGSGNGFHSNFYSTKAIMPTVEGSREELYRRISKLSVVPILDQWVEEGRSIDKQTLNSIIRKLRKHKRHYLARQISRWMAEKTEFECSSSEAAITLKVISEAQGMEQAEKYFNSLSRKNVHVYIELLNSYATARCVEKAEAVMQKMRDLGYANEAAKYYAMLNLYYKTENMEKLGALLQEMEGNGIVGNKYTLSIKLKAYAALRDVEKMDKIVTMMESDSEFCWTNYTVAAAGYKRVGLLNKAFEMLKKAEARLTSETDITAYSIILTQYASIGKKDEVLRVWSLYKKKNNVCNHGYKCILSSLVKLGDFEMAEGIFYEWESQDDLTYDISILNMILAIFTKKGLAEKAKAFIDRAILKGGKPNALTWSHLSEGCFQKDQAQKALEILKKAEACITDKTGENEYCHILGLYAAIGKKDEVRRVWSLFKKKHKVFNYGYKCILSSFVKLGDFEMAEEVFDEWESRDDLTYDMDIPNIIIGAYSRKGLMEKAEAIIDRAISKGGKPNASTWQTLVEGYLQNQQHQKAVEMMKKAIVISETGWKPDMTLFKACLEYLEGIGDTKQTEEFENLLQGKDISIVSLN